jgi:nucleotide-binding universal stress UspA family protein
MKGKPIVAGVEATGEGAWAASTAWRLAQTMGVPCLLVHAVPDPAIPPGNTPGVPDQAAFRNELRRLAQAELLRALEGPVPPEGLTQLHIRFGRAGRVLTTFAQENDAGLVVVGAKRHTALKRWVAGSTALDTIRKNPIPTLIATRSTAAVRRVLAAVDLSEAATATIAGAEEIADLLGAELRVLHAIEPVVMVAELPPTFTQADLEAGAVRVLETEIWPKVTRPGAERVVRHGRPVPVITDEAVSWDAHVIVVGSHGRNWIDRMLLGSVTEGLLRELPASVLVVPVPAPASSRPRRRRAEHAEAGV